MHVLAGSRPADPQTVKRLIDDALPDPVAGIGEPEPLRHMLAGAWSRRMTEEHRLVYLVDGADLSAGPSDQRWTPGGVGPRSRGVRALRSAGMESV